MYSLKTRYSVYMYFDYGKIIIQFNQTKINIFYLSIYFEPSQNF